jgi:hypothetical protein
MEAIRRRVMKKLFSAMTLFALMTGSTALAQTSNGAKELDKFGSICCEDEMARLDNFAVHLQQEPEAQGYIIFYEGRRYSSCYNRRARIPRRGEAVARAARLKPYLTDRRGLDAKRVIIINGGYRQEWEAELWIVPKGAEPPKPTPTLEMKDVKFRKGRIGKREYECMQ